jgi:dienelactone hydrolase
MRVVDTDNSVQDVTLELEAATLRGLLRLPPDAPALVLFAHGSGSGRLSPRNNYVANYLADAGLGSLLFDLLTPEEEAIDASTTELRFDIPLLTRRLVAATDWTAGQPRIARLPIAYFGASTGAAAALAAAAHAPERIVAIVSRGGRPDLAGAALPRVRAPTLLIVGGADRKVLELNREASRRMVCDTDVKVIPGATHLFAEPGALERVAALAAEWILRYAQAHRRPQAL